jgi:hypothetical protein
MSIQLGKLRCVTWTTITDAILVKSKSADNSPARVHATITLKLPTVQRNYVLRP